MIIYEDRLLDWYKLEDGEDNLQFMMILELINHMTWQSMVPIKDEMTNVCFYDDWELSKKNDDNDFDESCHLYMK